VNIWVTALFIHIESAFNLLELTNPGSGKDLAHMLHVLLWEHHQPHQKADNFLPLTTSIICWKLMVGSDDSKINFPLKWSIFRGPFVQNTGRVSSFQVFLMVEPRLMSTIFENTFTFAFVVPWYGRNPVHGIWQPALIHPKTTMAYRYSKHELSRCVSFG